MTRTKTPALAGFLDSRLTTGYALILNAVLAGFYYAFAGTDGSLAASVLLRVIVFFSLFSAASFPFAEAAFVGRASKRRDYKTVVFIRRAAFILTMGAVILFALLFAALSGPLSSLVLYGSSAEADLLTIRLTLVMGGIYGVLNGFFTWLRGFWQGMEENSVEEKAQMISVTVTYISAALIMMVMVYGFHLNRTLSVYGLGAGMILGQACGAGYLYLYDRMKITKIRRLAKTQMMLGKTKQKSFEEMTAFAAPSTMISFLAGLMILLPCFMCSPVSIRLGFSAVETRSILACTGLLIPVFAMSVIWAEQYSSAIHISRIAEARVKMKDKLQGRIDQMLIRFTASALPVSFSLGCLASVILPLFYGTDLTASAPELMIYGAAEGFLWALSLLLIELSMTLGYGSACVTYAFIALCSEAAIMWFLPYRLGLAGFALGTPLALCILCFLCMSKISNKRDISFLNYAVKCLRIILASMAMNGVYAIAKYFGLFNLSDSRMISILILAGIVFIAFLAGMFILSLSGIRLIQPKKKSKKKKG